MKRIFFLTLLIVKIFVSCDNSNALIIEPIVIIDGNITTTSYYDAEGEIIKKELIDRSTGKKAVKYFKVCNNYSNCVFSKQISYFSNGNKEVELYKFNEKTLIITYYKENGNKYYKEDNLKNKWYFWHESGQLKSESNNRNGKYKEYYENGNIRVMGFIKEYIEDSLWSYYSPTGDIVQEILYSKGKIINRNIIDSLAVDSLFVADDY